MRDRRFRRCRNARVSDTFGGSGPIIFLTPLTTASEAVPPMIWTLTIKLVQGIYAEGPWQATIAIDAASTLEDLHHAIQWAVEFDDDHLYELYVARTPRSRDRIRYDDENEGLYTRTVESVFPLPKDRRLYYLFDYGDSWVFQVSRARAKPFEAEEGVAYPTLIAEKGEKPPQYPEEDF